MKRTAVSRHRRLLEGGCTLVIVAMLSSFTPTPLYPLYQADFALSTAQISLIFAGYPFGVACVLVGLGGLGDRIGYRSTLLLGLGILAVSMVVLGFAWNFPTLVAGRALQGVGNGLALSAAAAALMQFHSRGPDRGSFVNTACVSVGVAAGPFVAGALAEATNRPRLTPYLLILALLTIPLLMVLRVKEPRRAVGRVRFVQPIRVPRAILRPFATAAGAVMITNLAFGFFGTFGPQIAHRLGWTSEAASGRLVSLTLVAVALAQFGGRRLSLPAAMSMGSALAVGGWAGIVVGTATLESFPVVVGALVLGVGTGLCLLGGAALTGMIAPPHRSAETYSAFLLVAFTTLAAASLAAGPAVSRFPLPSVIGGVCAGSSVLALWVIVGSRHLAKRPPMGDPPATSRTTAATATGRHT